jgi:carotenoid cleavage dioxygenase
MFAESTQGPDSDACPLERWTIDPASKSVVRKVLDKDAQEFPRPNEQMIGKPYRYTYTLALPEGRDPAFVSSTRIFKQDLVDRAREVHDFGAGHIPGEFVFIPRSGGKEEDDGWLIGYVIDTTSETTDLVIIDARNFEGPPVASIHIPHRIPPGFHGNWVPSV